ncbi:DNA binding protein vP5 [Microviridae sp.]|nr:DNA binding protein vP5 [Microviridae sp.]
MQPWKKLFKTEEQHDLVVLNIYDTKSKTYREKPIFAPTVDVMIRNYENFYRKPSPEDSQDLIFTNAEDFQLYLVGTYCQRSGVITSRQPEHVANLHEIKAAFAGRSSLDAVQ